MLVKNKETLDASLYHYNLGTLYAKMKELPKARLHLEMANKLNFETSMVQNNIKFIKNSLGVAQLENSPNVNYKTKTFFNSVPQDYLLTIMLFFVLVGGIYFKKSKNWILAIVLVLVGSIPMGLKTFYANNYSDAVVLTDKSLFEGPSNIFDQTGTLPAGLKVTISKERDGWLFIEFPDSYRGWVNKDDLGYLR